MKTATKTITPKTATLLLNKLNVHNRPLRNWKVDQYAADMKAGKWRFNSLPIIIGKTRLLDGQHRLWACIESGTPFKTQINYGLDDDVFDTIDIGLQRTAGDILQIAGVSSSHARNVAAAANLCIAYKTGKVYTKSAVSKPDIRHFVESNPALVAWVERARSKKGWTRTYSSPLCSVLFLAMEGNPNYTAKAEEFFQKFMTGENLTSGSPVLALRNRVATEKRMLKEERFALFTLAWNAFVKGRALTRMQAPRSEAFPTIVGAL